MRFTQIKYDGDRTAEIKWRGHHNSDFLETTLKSEDRPSPAFIDAMDALRAYVPKLIGADGEYADDIEVRGLHISYQKGDRRAYIIVATKPVSLTNGPFVINTPLIYEPDLDSDGEGQAPQDMLEAFDELVEQARLFVDGRREQGELELFEEGEKPRTNVARPNEAERARELDRVLLMLVGERPDQFDQWTDAETFGAVLKAFDERIPENADFAQFSHLNEAGTRRDRCAVSVEAGVPRIWFAVQGKIDPSTTPATLMGDHLVAAVRRIWAEKPNQQLSLEADENPVEAWAKSVRPAPAPSGEVTTEVVAQVLHTILFANWEQRAYWYEAHKDGQDRHNIFLGISEAFAAYAQGEDKRSFSEPIGHQGNEDQVEYVAVDLWVKNLRLRVALSKSKKQSLQADQLVDVVRGMLSIPEPQAGHEPAEVEAGEAVPV